MQKQYSYIIADPSFKKSITVNITEFPTVQDLKYLIGSAIDQEVNQFAITNATAEQQLSMIESGYEFQISFINCNQDINFILPDGNEIKINKSNEMNFDEIIKFIQREKSYYYSNKCLENMELYVWGIPIPKEGRHLSYIPNNVSINIQNDACTITLAYDQNTFILSNNETFVSVKEFIEDKLGPNADVTIQSFPDNKFLQSDDVLCNYKKYEINATSRIVLKSIDDDFVIEQKMDYLSTVLNAKQLIALYYGYNQKINFKNISIFYFDDEITDDNIRLNILSQIGPIIFFIEKDSSLLINDNSMNNCNCDNSLVRIIETDEIGQHSDDSSRSESFVNESNSNSSNSSESNSNSNNSDEQKQILNTNFVFNILSRDLIINLQTQLTNTNIKGRGASSEVFKVTHISDNFVFDINQIDTVYALKVFKREYFLRSFDDCSESDGNELDDKKIRRFMQEYEILARIDHPNIIKSIGCYLGDDQYSPCILFEYTPLNLDQLIKKENQSVTIVDLVLIIYEICEGMNCIHKLNIIHRDLKPSNILITSDLHVKLCDLGIATFNSDTVSHTVGIGSIYYMAPEIACDCYSHYNEKTDVYSFGIVLHFILSKGKLPRIMHNRRIIIYPDINNIAKNHILKCLSSNPSERPSFEEILDFIRENQFKLIDGIDFEELITIYDRLGLLD